jgi:hypothetical protein
MNKVVGGKCRIMGSLVSRVAHPHLSAPPSTRWVLGLLLDMVPTSEAIPVTSFRIHFGNVDEQRM